jgi:hypothetical protein
MFRNSITGGLLQFQLIRTLQTPDRNTVRAEKLPQIRFEIPFGAGNTAEKIEAERTVFGKRVTREMGLREEAKAGDSARAGELMPLRFADGAELHFVDHTGEQILQDRSVPQRLRRASKRFDNPLDSAHGARWHYA